MKKRNNIGWGLWVVFFIVALTLGIFFGKRVEGFGLGVFESNNLITKGTLTTRTGTTQYVAPMFPNTEGELLNEMEDLDIGLTSSFCQSTGSSLSTSKCSSLTKESCQEAPCCVSIDNGTKCVAGSKDGPTQSDLSFDTYHFMGTCYNKAGLGSDASYNCEYQKRVQYVCDMYTGSSNEWLCSYIGRNPWIKRYYDPANMPCCVQTTLKDGSQLAQAGNRYGPFSGSDKVASYVYQKSHF